MIENANQAEEQEIEISVEDDAVVEAKLSQDDELETYTKSVSKRINKLNAKTRAAEERANKLNIIRQFSNRAHKLNSSNSSNNNLL